MPMEGVEDSRRSRMEIVEFISHEYNILIWIVALALAFRLTVGFK
jgi:hypothetical protein